MNENDYVVYRHTSPNSKVYIGITCQKPEKRWNNGNGYKNSTKFYNAIQKYGWTNFKHEILFSGLNEISAKLIEEDLIYYYKKQNKSYNITDGGDGTKGIIRSEETRKKMSDAKKGKPSNRKEKPVNQFSLDGILIATYKSIKESAAINNINKGNIIKVCKGKQKTAGGFIWKYEK